MAPKSKFDSQQRNEMLKRQVGSPMLIKRGLAGMSSQGQTNTNVVQPQLGQPPSYQRPQQQTQPMAPRPVGQPNIKNKTVPQPYMGPTVQGPPQQSTHGTYNGIGNGPKPVIDGATPSPMANANARAQQARPPQLEQPNYGSSEVVGNPGAQTVYSGDYGTTTRANDVGQNGSGLTPGNISPERAAQAEQARNQSVQQGGQTQEDLIYSARVQRLKEHGVSIDEDGTMRSPDGTALGKIDDPSSWHQRAKDLLGDGQLPWGPIFSVAQPDLTQQPELSPGFVGYQQNNQNDANTANQNAQQYAQQQVDAELAKSNAAIRADYAQRQARAMRAAMEISSYGGGNADAQTATMGNIASQHQIAAEKEVHSQNLQIRLMQMKAQYDEAVANKDFERAKVLAAQSAQYQRELIQLQDKLQNQISGGDIFGGLLNVGSTALGAYIGGK